MIQRVFGSSSLLGLLSLVCLYPAFLAAQETQPPTPTPAPASPAVPGQKEAPKPAEVTPQTKGAGAPVDSSKYKVGPADILNILVWREPSFSGLFAVHSDGKITLPLVGDLDVGGHTPVEIQDTVKDALTKYIVSPPNVTVTVQEVLSKRYYMDGLSARPGEYALTTPTTVLEAISRAGGLQDFANAKRIYILRGSRRIPFNYKEVIKGKNLKQNIELQPDDHIVVP
ncbi:MAG: polysaccharide biosynthesis/export family protein [Acidobacteriaceae bacterium]|nr:polysaccharide biosynthesis/export family protein [Acidobacteriaceae bacterium]